MTYSNAQIDSTAADHSTGKIGDYGGISWDRIRSGGATGQGQVTQTNSQYIASIAAFKEATGGGSTTPQSVAGSMPAPSGTVVRKAKVGRAGSMPAASGGITQRIIKAVRTGAMPAASGALVRKTSVGRAGSMPAPTGTVSASTGLSQSLSGAMPAPTGGILFTAKLLLSGLFSEPSGALSRKTSFGLAGSMPGPAGDAATALQLHDSESGAMPAPSGTVAGVKTVLSAVAKVWRVIGSGFRKIIG